MSLTSSSTIEDALAQYNDNLSWDGDATKAGAALEAVRFLLVNRPLNMTAAGITHSFEQLAAERQRLEDFLRAASTSQPRRSFTRGRMLTY